VYQLAGQKWQGRSDLLAVPGQRARASGHSAEQEGGDSTMIYAFREVTICLLMIAFVLCGFRIRTLDKHLREVIEIQTQYMETQGKSNDIIAEFMETCACVDKSSFHRQIVRTCL